jgi:hypothetical protein
MSLARSEIRWYAEHDVKRALKIICEIRGKTEAEFCEEIIAPIVMQQIHEASLINARATVAGITRRNPEKHGEPRSAKEKHGGER